MSAVRQVVLDTETTGLDPAEGHRIIEIGCVELINRRRTRNDYQAYCHPEREIDEAALGIHGITNEFLADKPRFVEVARDFLAYVKDAELVIHNAEFDTNFLNHELGRIGSELGVITDYCEVLDTLKLARQAHPGQRNDLDSLCQRYHIDNTQRSLHGALLDAEILADVYLLLTGGQTALSLDAGSDDASGGGGIRRLSADRKPLPVLRASVAEAVAHEDLLGVIEKAAGKTLWAKMEGACE